MIQNELPEDGTHTPIIFYADSTQISNFRSKNFHPIVVRLGNIPSSIWNGQKRGRGVLAGYIPVVRFRI